MQFQLASWGANNLNLSGVDAGASNTPANIQKALERVKAYVDSHPNQPPLITINCWNEWTEDSYFQPDDLRGFGYLEAVKTVFGAA